MQSKKHKTQGSASANAKKTPFFKQVWFWMLLVAVVIYIGILLWRNPITKPDTNPTFPTITHPETQIHTCKVGETFDAGGMHITYLGVETWLPEGETAHPKEGYTFIRVKIAAENKATEDREIYDNEFTCYADGGVQIREHFTNDRLPDGVVAPGQRVEGYLYFSVPVDVEPLEISYQSVLYWRYNVVILPVELPE